MLAVYLHGFILSAAMILPLGPQNVFVMNQGIKRQHHLMSASLCALSDIILICAGIFGGSALLSRSPLLLALVTWGGVAFLMWYGWGGIDGGVAGGMVLLRQQRVSRRGAGAYWSPYWPLPGLILTFIWIPLLFWAVWGGSYYLIYALGLL